MSKCPVWGSLKDRLQATEVIPDERSRRQEGRGKKAGRTCSKCKHTRQNDAKLITMPVDQTKGKKYKSTRDLSLGNGK